jgi:2-methylisocitrate lyase-like PEP mutase family enzyme
MIIARVESLVLNKGMKDALYRADRYLEAGADGILIHSKNKDGSEILEFCEKYHKQGMTAPLVVVPSTYSQITDQQLLDVGVKVIIYANHLLRAAYPAMVKTARSILANGRSWECETELMPVGELIKLIPGGP